LTRLGNEPVIVGEKQREPHVILGSEDRRLSGFGGCNQLLGSYELNGDKLSFSKMAATQMACLQDADIERTFLDALTKVQTWKIKGEHLEVFDVGGNRVARFESRYLK
jgi:heat shock protein HslJ